MLRIPGIKRPFKRHKSVFLDMDMIPTLLDALSITGQWPLEGVSHWAALSGQTNLGSSTQPMRNVFWEREAPWGYSYGVLSADGKWRYSNEADRPEILIPESLSRVDDIKTANLNVVASAENRDLVVSLQEKFKAWHRTNRTLKLKKEILPTGIVKYSGDDFQRTPGTAKFTFGAAIKYAKQAMSDAGVLAGQPNIWQLKLERGVLKFIWKNIELEGALFSSNKCQTIIVSTAAVLPGILSDAKYSIAKLFLNGVKIAEKTIIETQLPVEYPPTFVGGLESKKPASKILIANVKMRNNFIYDGSDGVNPSGAEFSSELCE